MIEIKECHVISCLLSDRKVYSVLILTHIFLTGVWLN